VLQYPAQNTNLAPSALDLLVHPKRHLSGQRFVNDDNDDISPVTTWLQSLDQDLFAKGFSALVSRRKKCLKMCGDYTEK
jgi:hypothetical protein